MCWLKRRGDGELFPRLYHRLRLRLCGCCLVCKPKDFFKISPHPKTKLYGESAKGTLALASAEIKVYAKSGASVHLKANGDVLVKPGTAGEANLQALAEAIVEHIKTNGVVRIDGVQPGAGTVVGGIK